MPFRPLPNTRTPADARPGRLRHVWAASQARMREQAGFTIIEVLVACVVLIIGLLTAFNALDLTAHTSQITRARQGAINLARQIDEDARALQYTSLTSSSAVTTALQAMPGLSSTSSGSTWTIKRYNGSSTNYTLYTVSVTEADQAAVSLTTLSQKAITVSISWTLGGQTRNYTETTTISSGGQGVNTAATSLQWSIPSGTTCSSPCSSTTPVITSAMGISTMTFTVQTPANMSGVNWEVNGVSQSWSSSYAITNSTTWTWTTTTSWNISNLPDGTYEIGAASQNGSSTGNYTKIYVRLQRGIPSAPSFSAQSTDGYGFNTNLYKAGVLTTVAELDWSGSNSPSATGNSGDYNTVGYKITSPSGNVCETGLTSFSGATTSFPGTCGTNYWCSSAYACIDFSPPSTTATSGLTYTVSALYYNSANTLTAGPSTSATLTNSSAITYTYAGTTANTGTNCATGTSVKDMSRSATLGSTQSLGSTGSTVTANFCSDAATQATTIGGGGQATVYFDNQSTSACTVTGTLNIDGSFFGITNNPAVSIPKNTTTPTPVTFNWTFTNPTLSTGDRINTNYSWSCGKSGSAASMYWGSTAYTSKFATGTQPLQTPSAPTTLGVSSATNTDGTTTATVTWKAPTTGISIKAYRIYRDGQNYGNRYYEDTASNLCTSGNCTWTDSERSATHSYYVTAVGNTTAGSNMMESSMLGPTTG